MVRRSRGPLISAPCTRRWSLRGCSSPTASRPLPEPPSTPSMSSTGRRFLPRASWRRSCWDAMRSTSARPMRTCGSATCLWGISRHRSSTSRCMTARRRPQVSRFTECSAHRGKKSAPTRRARCCGQINSTSTTVGRCTSKAFAQSRYIPIAYSTPTCVWSELSSKHSPKEALVGVWISTECTRSIRRFVWDVSWMKPAGNSWKHRSPMPT